MALLSIILLHGFPASQSFSFVHSLTKCQQFTPREIEKRRRAHPLYSATYGRGAEIWPPSNEDPIQLADSFPNGKVPYSAMLDFENADMAVVHDRVEEAIQHEEQPKKISKRKFMSTAIRRILRRAAAREELDSEDVPSAMDRTPSVIAVALFLRGLIRPLDVLFVSLMTGYFIILWYAARSPRDNSDIPMLPALPPQGHVPTMVSNPMGLSFTYSKSYDLWLKMGVVTGLLGPLVLLGRYLFVQKGDLARVCARPIFLLCCQAVTEAISRRFMVRERRCYASPVWMDKLKLTSVTFFGFVFAFVPLQVPLPIRILIPVVYNAVRLCYLWSWVTFPTHLGYIGRGLAIANAVYWTINLFAFLLPIATIRYMRAHFFAVEAEVVVTRAGLEETVGLIPQQQ